MRKGFLRNKYLVFFVLAIVSLFCFVSLLLFTPHTTKANPTSVDSDFEVSISEVLAFSLSNCDSTSSSVVNIDITPTKEGVFKSNCQEATVHTNAPGYSLTVKASGSNPNYESGATTNNLLYLNPNTLQELPIIPSTTHTIANPSTLTNNTWGFAVEGTGAFDANYTIDNKNNTYAELPTTDTTVYSTNQLPVEAQQTFYYGTNVTTQTTAGTYGTTVTYTAIGELPVEYPGFWHTDGRDIINPYNDVTLLKAFNIDTSTAVWYDDAYPNLDRVLVQHNDFTYAELESLGINAVRFNFPARLIADSCTTDACLDYDNSEDVFELFDEILTHASNHNIGVIFNIHHPYGMSNPRDTSNAPHSYWNVFLPENIEKNTALWEKIATRYKDDIRVLGYDLMNEPTIQLESNQTAADAIAKWDVVAQDMINRIRAIDENHMIIVERANRGLKDDGYTQVGFEASYVFPNVSDPQNNIMFEFHNYGVWSYVTQSEDRIESDPWVWPTPNYVGVIKDFTAVNTSGYEVWPPARFSSNTNTQNTWVTVESNNGLPIAINSRDPEYNLGRIAIITNDIPLESSSVYYIDDIVIEQYDANDVFEKIVYEQHFRYSDVLNSNENGAVVFDSLVCENNDGGCYKIFGPTTKSVEVATHQNQLRMFKIDASKKYKVSARIYAENIPADANLRITLSIIYGSDEQVKPYDKSYLQTIIQQYIKYSEDNDVPIFNGEYGVLINGEFWDEIGAEQFVNDSLEVYEEKNINAAYFQYYNQKTAAGTGERASGFRVRESNIAINLPITADNTVLNTKLRDVFLNHL